MPLSLTVLGSNATPPFVFLIALPGHVHVLVQIIDGVPIRNFTHRVHHRDVTEWFAPGSDRQRGRKMEINNVYTEQRNTAATPCSRTSMMNSSIAMQRTLTVTFRHTHTQNTLYITSQYTTVLTAATRHILHPNNRILSEVRAGELHASQVTQQYKWQQMLLSG